MVISCDECARQHTSQCADCVVTHLLGADDHGVELDHGAEQTVRLFVRAGLLPGLRHARAV